MNDSFTTSDAKKFCYNSFLLIVMGIPQGSFAGFLGGLLQSVSKHKKEQNALEIIGLSLASFISGIGWILFTIYNYEYNIKQRKQLENIFIDDKNYVNSSQIAETNTEYLDRFIELNALNLYSMTRHLNSGINKNDFNLEDFIDFKEITKLSNLTYEEVPGEQQNNPNTNPQQLAELTITTLKKIQWHSAIIDSTKLFFAVAFWQLAYRLYFVINNASGNSDQYEYDPYKETLNTYEFVPMFITGLVAAGGLDLGIVIAVSILSSFYNGIHFKHYHDLLRELLISVTIADGVWILVADISNDYLVNPLNKILPNIGSVVEPFCLLIGYFYASLLFQKTHNLLNSWFKPSTKGQVEFHCQTDFVWIITLTYTCFKLMPQYLYNIIGLSKPEFIEQYIQADSPGAIFLDVLLTSLSTMVIPWIVIALQAYVKLEQHRYKLAEFELLDENNDNEQDTHNIIDAGQRTSSSGKQSNSTNSQSFKVIKFFANDIPEFMANCLPAVPPMN